MKESFVDFLFSPLILLFLINSFFLIFATTYLWHYFNNIRYNKMLAGLPQICRYYSLIVKLALFIAVILIAGIVEYYYPFQNINFFPLLYSEFIKLNLIGVFITSIGLLVIKQLDKKLPKFSIINFFFSFISITYLLYLIVIMATLICRLNAFSDLFLEKYSYAQAKIINAHISYTLFIVHLIFVLFLVSFKRKWRFLLLVTYILLLAGIYYHVNVK